MAKQNEQQLNTFNQQLRSNPEYVRYLNSIGVNTDRAWGLSDQQRKQAASWVAQQYGDLGGLEIDQAGNANQNEGFGKQLKKWGPIAAAGAATVFGVPGLWGGLLGGGAPASTGALASGVTGSAAPTAASGGGMGLWGSIGKFLGGHADDIIGGVGSALGSGSQASAQNRGEKLSAQMDLDKLLMLRDQDLLQRQILREQEGRTGRQDAWRAMMQAQHALSPAQRPNVTPYAAPQRQATDVERAGAQAMSDEVMARLRGGNPIAQQTLRPLNTDMGLADAGLWEKIFGYAGPGLAAYGALRNMGDGYATTDDSATAARRRRQPPQHAGYSPEDYIPPGAGLRTSGIFKNG